MSLISNERRALLVEHNSSWLSAGGELNLHGSFLVHLENVAIGGDAEQIALSVLGWTVQRHGQLVDAFVVCGCGLLHIYF